MSNMPMRYHPNADRDLFLGVGGIVILAVIATLAVSKASSILTKVALLKAGKRYRFFFRITPPLLAGDSATLPTGLNAAGASDISVTNSDSETVGSYVMTALSDKELNLTKPLFQVQGKDIFITKVDEL